MQHRIDIAVAMSRNAISASRAFPQERRFPHSPRTNFIRRLMARWRHGKRCRTRCRFSIISSSMFSPSTPLAGNPLAVVMNTCGLTTEQMQAIAREFNLSETTFVERRALEVERAEGVRVRIFTAQEELPFAGHPTLGTASVLKADAPETLRRRHRDAGAEVGPCRCASSSATAIGRRCSAR